MGHDGSGRGINNNDDCKESLNLQNYYALSYVWGSVEKPKTLLCNGRKFAVTASIFEALSVLKATLSTNNNVLIWIDAICVSQSDSIEVGYSVRNMESRNWQDLISTPPLSDE